MYIQWHTRKYSFAGRIYSMTLLSSVSKEGRDVRYTCRKPAQPLHSLGWLHCQSIINAALGIGSPGCFQPWRVERFPHCALITFRWVLFCSCKTLQKKDPNWTQEWKKNGRAACFEWGSFIRWCPNPFCSGTVPLEKAPLSSLSFLQLSLCCSLFMKLLHLCLSMWSRGSHCLFQCKYFFCWETKGAGKREVMGIFRMR